MARVGDGVRVEHDHVGEAPLRQPSPPGQPEVGRRQGAQPAHRLGQAADAPLAHVVAEETGKTAVGAGMGRLVRARGSAAPERALPNGFESKVDASIYSVLRYMLLVWQSVRCRRRRS